MKQFDGGYFGFQETMAKAHKIQPRCYESHPALKIGGYEIFGGSCGNPMVKDADVYLGFDGSMETTYDSYPWHAKRTEVYFPVKDMSVPSDAKEFKLMVEWTADQLKAGKKVHAGCIGGHGRTGMFFAALVKTMTGEDDAITYVRNHYCDKAVESASQIDWLHKHFGITKVKANKVHTFFDSPKGKKGKSSKGYGTQADLIGEPSLAGDIFPVESKKSIWGKLPKP